MRPIFNKIILIVIGLSTCIATAATPPQTLKDSMNGNWAVINGQKRFLSGMNIAWLSSNSFGNDVGDNKIDINSFTDKVKNVRKAGGNSLRWWLHTDASHSPKIDATGAVTGLGTSTISNMRSALDSAYAYGVVVSMCLFSFDLLVPGSGTGKAAYSSYNLDNNYKFLTDTSKITTYLQNGLKPILDSVGSHPAVMCWEVFNEPEGMLASANWSNVTKKIDTSSILRITNRIAGFVHRNSKKMVSTGIAAFNFAGIYSDAKLKAAGGDNDGFLDFYMVHYYPEWQDQTLSPFQNPSSNWNMDRPILIGEFPAKSWSTGYVYPDGNSPKTTKTITDAFNYAYSNGYVGAMSWAMTQSDTSLGDYTTTAPALTTLFNAHKSDIMIKDVTIQDISGDYAMSLALTTLPLPSGTANYFELGTSFTQNFTGKSNVLFDMYVQPGSGKNIQFQMVIKVTSAYTWSPAASNIINLSSVNQGAWTTVSIPVSAFGASSLTDVREILFQYFATGSPYTGTIYFDNVRVDNDTLYDFNTAGSTWSTGADAAIVGLVKRSDISSSILGGNTPGEALRQPIFSARGQSLTFRLFKPAAVRLSLFDLTGKTVATINCGTVISGMHTVKLGGIVSGHYIAELRFGREKSTADLMVQ